MIRNETLVLCCWHKCDAEGLQSIGVTLCIFCGHVRSKCGWHSCMLPGPARPVLLFSSAGLLLFSSSSHVLRFRNSGRYFYMGGCYLAGHASIRNMLLFSGAVVVHEWSLKAVCFPDMHRCLSGFSHRAKLNRIMLLQSAHLVWR